MKLHPHLSVDRKADGNAKKLVLARETLRTLSSDELRLAAGGARSSTSVTC